MTEHTHLPGHSPEGTNRTSSDPEDRLSVGLSAEQNDLRIGVLGTGALGTLMLSQWQPHHSVSVHNRSKISGRHQHQSFVLLPFEGTAPDDLRNIEAPRWAGESLDWLVVTTKAAATRNALDSVRSWLPQVSRIMLLQNGMGQQDEVAQWLAEQSLYCELWAATTTHGAYVKEADAVHPLGYVVHAGQGQTHAGCWLPASTTSPDQTASGPATALLPQSMLPQSVLPEGVLPHADIRQLLLGKLAINAIINPLTAKFRCLNGALLTHEYRQTFDDLAHEVSDLFAAMHWSVGFDIYQRAVEVAESTAANRSSTLQDVLQQRPTELPYITGYLLNEARRCGLSAPVNQALYHTLCPEEGS